MLTHTIDRFQAWADATGGLWVVENVEGAKQAMRNPLKLCGSMFNLTDDQWLLRRHRYFDSNAPLMAPGPCRCHGRPIMGVYGELVRKDRRCAGRRLNRPNGDIRAGVDRARRLMGMPWASAEGLPLAIPPAYTRFIGEQLLAHIEAVAA
jgi:DNA (cytosine-5)-methyltransferase 1